MHAFFAAYHTYSLPLQGHQLTASFLGTSGSALGMLLCIPELIPWADCNGKTGRSDYEMTDCSGVQLPGSELLDLLHTN